MYLTNVPININDLEPVSEAYKGKSSRLKQCEELANIIVKKIHNGYEMENFEDITNCKEAKTMRQLLEREFGIQRLELIFSSIASEPFTITKDDKNITFPMPMVNNALTIPVTTIPCFSQMYNLINMKVLGKRGAFTPYMYVHVIQSIVYTYELTGEELLAFILHEIGHNYTMNVIGSVAVTATTVLDPLSFTNIIKAIDSKIIDFVYTRLFLDAPESLMIILDKLGMTGAVKFIKFISGTFSKMVQSMMDFLPVQIGTIMNLYPIMKKIITTGTSLSAFTKSVYGRMEETNADSFAVANGYGAALASATSKIGNFAYDKGLYSDVYSIPGVGEVSEMADIISLMLQSSLDPHPDAQTRIKNSLDKLKRDYAKNKYTPEYKAELEKQIKSVEKIYQDFLKRDNTALVSQFRKATDKYMGGKHPYEILLEPFNRMSMH